ncbi:MAG TPA: J domain-containing protein [Micromonosporaceae bacterium]|jgi:curved DNA-binding protein
MAASGDFYQTLGVSPTASAAEIQRAYRELARQYHPDVNSDPSAEERFKEIGEAYQVLSDPETRRRYDAYGPEFRRVPEGAGARPRGRRSTAGARPGAGARAGPAGGPDEDFWFRTEGADVDLEDLFGGMFGGRRGWGPIPGADQEAQLELSLEDAYRGGRRSVTLSGPGGTRSYEVTIPAGVVDGQRIRLAGQGGQGTDGATPGDLYLVVRIAPDPRYRVDGRNVTTTLPVTAWEAALGAAVTVATPTGDKKLTIPPGTSSGRRLRMRGQGIPDPRGRPGDLYAEVRIMVPPKPSQEERRLFEELAAVSTFNPRSSP